MKRFFTSIFALVALILCANFGSSPSSEGRAKPRINFYGTLTAPDGSKSPIKNILIGGIYEHIPFFNIPTSEHITPSSDTTYLNLDDIDSIKPVSLEKKESVHKFKGRDYIKLELTLKKTAEKEGNTLKRYFLLDVSRKLFCDQITPAGDLQREVLFEALSELTILGFRPGDKNNAEPSQQKSAAQEALCAEAKKDIAQLEVESKGLFPDLLKKIKNSVNYICG